MKKNTIKHIWFDFSETISFLKKERHNLLRYETYSKIASKPITDELKREYEDLYEKNSHSNAAVFRSLGMASAFWSERVNSVDPSELYTLADDTIPDVLKQLQELVPISIFSNLKLDKVLPALNINPSLFTLTLNSEMIKEPKPALDGFFEMVKMSTLPANEILYIGDDIEKDVLPAKQVGVLTGLMWKKSKEADYFFESFKEILNLFI